ncbi:MAG: T9SS type A sorting domain-containing protein [Bacteroidia bacterium]|nr:MAG: T9SS type A sorting domain-containing protein [Bacteroidia bacterium]
MKRSLRVLLVGLLALVSSGLAAQIITTDPALPTSGQAVTIYYDATLGTGGLKDYTGDVYAHTGVLTNLSSDNSDWRYVLTSWGTNTAETKMTRESANLYSLVIGPSIRQYYGVAAGETITHLAFVFRSSDSSKEGKGDGGSDIFVEVFKDEYTISILTPGHSVVADPEESIVFEAAANSTSVLSLFDNGVLVKSGTGLSLNHSFSYSSSGDHWIKVSGTSGNDMASDSVFVHILGVQAEAPVPEGLKDGINNVDDQTVQLVLYAPGKVHAFVVGDFNDWTPGSEARMTKDGERFWITLNMLELGKEYAYQYLVDGSMFIADPYSEKVLDPSHDKGISEATYPGLKSYPTGLANGIVGVLQPGQTAFPWEDSAFQPPESEDLVIYELLLRDFIAAHDWKTLSDTLDYISNLGINAIELMPVNEFEGNESWGYNPSFYFAADKYYGPAVDLKAFIDACHSRGLAVIIDMVLNHSYGQSPLVQLYYDNSSKKVTADNPWYNVDSPNPVFSWGYDFNHESQATKDFVDRVNRYWLEEFHVDGFRFDFTKGFTNTPGDGSGYDAPRIAILRRMANEIWTINENTYVILEHLAANQEEYELSLNGMMLWGNQNYNYGEAAMGYHDLDKSDFSGISYLERGWIVPALVGYMESHDEERLMYKNKTYGNSSGEYDIQDHVTALGRMELAGAFFFSVPGPKMIWQFGELGYDYSIDYDCRVCSKPIRWDYNTGKRRRLYQVWSALIGLKTSEAAFRSDDFTLTVSDESKRIEINHPDMDVRIIGNFDVVQQSVDPSFSATGWWYSYFEGDSLQVTDLNGTIALEPGQFQIFTTKKLSKPEITARLLEYEANPASFQVYPNPFPGWLQIEPVPENSRLTVIQSSGQVIDEMELQENQDQVDLSTLPPGLYFLIRRTRNVAPVYVKVIRE